MIENRTLQPPQAEVWMYAKHRENHNSMNVWKCWLKKLSSDDVFHLIYF